MGKGSDILQEINELNAFRFCVVQSLLSYTLAYLQESQKQEPNFPW
jgi:hypothetical protein